MQFQDYKEINLYSFHFNQPEFESNYNIFISKLTNNIDNDNKNTNMNIKTDSLRLLSFKDNVLQIEFLYSSNNFYKFISNLDSYSKEEIIKNGSEWFGNNLNTDTINNIFKSSVHLPDKLPAFPTIHFKLDEKCKIIGKKRKKLTSNELKPNMEIELSFTVDGVHFQKNKCNLVYNVHQIKIINDICQSIESLFAEDEEVNTGDIDSEANDVTASTFQ